MIETYLVIVNTIRQNLKWANWIDWDKGQLEDPEKFNSIIVPGILIDPANVDWEQLGKGFQFGAGPITVKLVTTLSSQTHAGDPFLDLNQRVQVMAEELHTTLITLPSLLRRTGSPKPYWSGTFFVIEQTYEFRHTYQPPSQMAQRPIPNISTIITLPV